MPGSIRQKVTLDPTPSDMDMMFGTPEAMWAAFPLATLPGSTILAMTQIANLSSNTITAFSDTVNGSWPSALRRLSNPSFGSDNALWCLQNAASIPAGAFGRATSAGTKTTLTDNNNTWTTNQWAGAFFRSVNQAFETTVLSNTAHTLTLSSSLPAAVANGETYVVGGWLKATASGFDDFNAFTIVEVQGVAASSLIDHNAAVTTTSTPGTNDISTGSIAGGSAPATIVCFGVNDVDNHTTYVPLADTTATDDGTAWSWSLGQPIMRIQHYNKTNPGTFTGHFSSQATGGDHYQSFIVGLRDATNAPTAGSIALTGLGPVMNIGIKVSTASLGLTGVASAVLPGVAPQMLQGVLQLVGLAPQLALGIILTGGGNLGLTGNAPVLSTGNTTLIPGTGSAQITGAAPGLLPKVIPTAGALGLVGAAPQLGLNIVMGGVTTGALSLASSGPSIGPGIVPPAGTIVLTAVGLRAPNIAPSAGSLTLTGLAPTPNQGSPIAVPAAVAISMQGVEPNLTLSVPAPPTANLVLGGYAPQLFFQYFLTPGTGALSVVGNLLGGQVTNVQLGTTPGQVLISGAAPALGIRLNTAAGALVVAGQAPVIVAGTVLVPSTAALQFSGAAPAFAGGLGLAPSAGSLSLAGTAPVVTRTNVIPAGSVAIAGQAPKLGLTIAPSVGNLAFAGAAGTVNGQTIIVPSVGALSFSGSVPTQNYFRTPSPGAVALATAPPVLNLGMTPAVGSLAVLGGAASVSQAGLPLPQTGVIAVTGAAPRMDLRIAVPAGGLALSSALPLVNSLTTLTPAAGSITFASVGSGVLHVGVIVPPSGRVGFSSDPSQMSRQGFAAPGTVRISINGGVPIVYQTTNGFIIPGTASLSMVGQPAINSLYTMDDPLIVILPGPVDYIVIL